MITAQTHIEPRVRQRPSVNFDALQKALERPEEEIKAEVTQQQSGPERVGDVAVAMRLATEAIAAAAKAADIEVRKIRELLQQSEARARAAEQRAQAAEERAQAAQQRTQAAEQRTQAAEQRTQAAEQQAREWQKVLMKIRNQIVQQVPEQAA